MTGKTPCGAPFFTCPDDARAKAEVRVRTLPPGRLAADTTALPTSEGITP